MKNKLELRLDACDKCSIICDTDCSLGQLYDYSCALTAFIMQKMKEAEDQKKAESKPPEAE